MQIEIDVEKCIASGACVLACPEVFDQDDEGIVIVLDKNPPEELHEAVRDAMHACPASVITLQE